MAIRAFCAYSSVDEKLKRDLMTAMSPLSRLGLLSVWHFRVLAAGREWEPELSYHLHSADVILLLVSSDFINSDYCYGIEMAAALERHDTGAACVIPILLRDCLWEGLPLSRLQVLPNNGRPVRSWPNKDAAWADIARGVQKSILDFPKDRTLSRKNQPDEKEVSVSNGKPHNNFFDVARAGDKEVAAEDELRFAVASVRLCERIMRTISYKEEDWWKSHAGHEYLEEQRKLLARGAKIERIFIVPGTDGPENLIDLTDIFDRQSSLGVDVFFVYEHEIPKGYFAWVQDFILYDDKLLRVSTTVPAHGVLGRTAEIHTLPEMIRRGLQWFNGLRALSTPWTAAS